MKIAFVMSHDTEFFKLGSEIYAENLALSLSSFRNEIHIFRAFSKKDGLISLGNVVIHNHRSPSIPFIGSYIGMRRSLKSFHKIDSLQKSDWVFIIGGGVGLISKKIRDHNIAFLIIEIAKEEYKSIPTSFQRFKSFLFYSMLNIGEYLGVKYSKIVLCNSNYQFNQVKTMYNDSSKKFVYSPLGISERWFLDTYFQTGSKKILFVGSGNRRNVSLFLNMIKMMNESGYDISGILIREDEDKVRKICKDLNISVEIYNNLPENALMSKYRESLVLIMPSYKEAFCLPIVEAASQYVPTIASDLPQFQDIIEDGITGLVIRDYNLDNWVYQLKRLIDDPEFLNSLRYAARKKSEHFRLSLIASEINTMLRNDL